ncbi:DUF4386 family protein [Dactylosporangium aurantiacum]|uniref:DUF4386 family protein n=1 Tax=Dactylosporangium aurantiacum TaxID=35754 RepID=A0A9Q9MHV5_9ACTN|nr:DUF4386 family protein [Dactylosporangium aurantiacum]MDG6106577.1 DUF4386 family protein [Dactylosporangium aurantiacum]UWZ50397.1 DUF4386 family protein [Dactylosporangium aurantiacum]
MAHFSHLRTGGICVVLGAVAFTTARLLHGDTPAAHAEAALHFVASRPSYAAVHLVAVFAAVLTLAGLVALVRSLTRPSAALLGRAGLASSMVGLAVFAVESTSEGLALPELSAAAEHATPEERADLIGAAHAVAAATHGPSLIAMALLYGIGLALIGAALVLHDAPAWLGWAGVAVGTVTLLAASGLFLSPSLFPGALLYGILGSVLAQLWLLAAGLTMLRRAWADRS